MASERNAIIIIPGDYYDFMQGLFDPRKTPSEMRSEYADADDYIDRVIEDAVKWLKPYKHNLAIMGDGNHETKIKQRLQTDVIQRTVALLNSSGASIKAGGYSGWARFQFLILDKKNQRIYNTTNLNYHHGSGYSSRSKKIRRAHQHPDAHILTFGHHHVFTQEKIARNRMVPEHGSLYNDIQTLLECGGYKDDTGDGYGGWATEKGHDSKVNGAWWIRFYYDRPSEKVLYEAIECV